MNENEANFKDVSTGESDPNMKWSEEGCEGNDAEIMSTIKKEERLPSHQEGWLLGKHSAHYMDQGGR